MIAIIFGIIDVGDAFLGPNQKFENPLPRAS
jgi:hypothetical protein